MASPLEDDLPCEHQEIPFFEIGIQLKSMLEGKKVSSMLENSDMDSPPQKK